MEGYLEGMWLDMWIVPNYLEAERGGFLQEWLLENEPRGSCNLHYEMIAVLTSATSASNAYTAEDLNLSGIAWDYAGIQNGLSPNGVP